ncbi:hypothetical protein F7725_011813 [Dissostichus mawsoni]|uniref:Uncharacterized protein n=1 Tax=Dissostichus mawsoni TaxID=36200 RepID=A0A7J5Z9W8_DISMA|nr:hypothetical protein F7725_011813 [Dissostichus mawsoni]
MSLPVAVTSPVTPRPRTMSYMGSAQSQVWARDRGHSLSSLTRKKCCFNISNCSLVFLGRPAGVRAGDVDKGAFEGVCAGLALAEWADFFDVLLLFESDGLLYFIDILILNYQFLRTAALALHFGFLVCFSIVITKIRHCQLLTCLLDFF